MLNPKLLNANGYPSPSGDATDLFGGEFAHSVCQVVVRLLPHAVILLDDELRVVLWNCAASRLFRLWGDAARGTPIASIIQHANLANLLRECGERRTKVIETLLPAASRGGAPLTLRINAVALNLHETITDARRASDAQPIKGDFRLLVIEDITEKAALEQQLVESEKQVAMGQLAAGILHEVTNPLTSIGSNLLFVRNALSASPATEVIQSLDVSLEQLDQMRQMLGTLSGFPRRPAPKYESADVHEVVRRCVTFIAKDAERRRIGLAVSFAPSVVACEMDVRMIKQVLLNLLKNAMEAMPDGGGLEVRTSYRAPEQNEPAAVVIEIADSGIGIPDCDLRKVFRPLFSTKPRGAGLGLSFCRQAVEEHGGEIRLVSRGKGHGTLAVVSLPIRQAATRFD